MLQSEFPEKHKTFLQYRNADQVEKQGLSQSVLDDMACRFEKLFTRLNKLHRWLVFEEVKCQLLMSLTEIETHLAMWHAKYCDEDSITWRLIDYQVCIIFVAISLWLLAFTFSKFCCNRCLISHALCLSKFTIYVT